jgi:hypothetical protein
MASCRNHPDRNAEATCSVCGIELCEECVAPGDGAPSCFDCSITSTGQDLARKQASETARQIPKPPQPRLSRSVRALFAIGFVIICTELALIFFMRPQPMQTAAPSDLDTKKNATAETAADVVLISEGLEEHRRTHGQYPEDLWDLAEYLPEELIERLSDSSTQYELDERGGYSVRFTGKGPHPVAVTAEDRVPKVEGVDR